MSERLRSLCSCTEDPRGQPQGRCPSSHEGGVHGGPGSGVQIVHSNGVTDQPELLLRALGPLDLRDDGRIYCTGFGVLDDDFGLYQALPLGPNTSRFLPRSRAQIGR